MRKLILTMLLAGLAGWVGARVAQAEQDPPLQFRDAVDLKTLFRDGDLKSAPVPYIPKDWRLVSATQRGDLWFQDSQGNVYTMMTSTKEVNSDEKLGVSAKIYRIQAR